MRRKRALALPLVAGAVMLSVALLLQALGAPAAAAPSAAPFPVIADFEGGFPPGWFQYGDGGTTLVFETAVIPDTDPAALPGQIGDNEVLSATVDVPTWAGFGAALNPAQNWSDYDAVSFWFYGEASGTVHEFEIQTATGDDRRASFTDSISGWRQVIFPFHTFGAGGAYDVSQVDNWVFVLDGTSGSLKLDNLQLVNLLPFADFEGGVPAGWFQYGDGGTTLNIETVVVPDTDPTALPGQIGDNEILSATVNVPTWAGFGAALNPAQNWSDLQGVGFWFYGENSGTTHEFEIQTVSGDDRRATFVDNFVGWQYITLPFPTFGAGGAYDVSQVDNWVFVLDGTVGSLKMDDVAVYGDAGSVTRRVAFESETYSIVEGGTAFITVTLNVTSTEAVTVTYATSDGTAVAGVDYTATSGMLVFVPGESSQAFAVETIGNSSDDGERSVVLTLSDPVNAELGAPNPATLAIVDDDASVGGPKVDIIDDWNDGQLPSGTDPNGIDIGFATWGDPSSSVAITTTTVISAGIDPLPGGGGDNPVLQFNANIASWGGFTHAFENETVTEWVSQDWSAYEGFSLWVYGTGSGTTLFVDILDNRNPASTSDDAERWTYAFPDSFLGWQQINIPFGDFTRKEIGNGAPNDGFTLTEVHGWALGALNTGGDETRYVDDVGLLVRVDIVDDWEDGQLPAGTDPNGIDIGFVTWSDGSPVAIMTTTVAGAGIDPVPGVGNDTNIVLQFDANIGSWGGFSHAFENETVTEWVSQDWSSYEGICFWLYGTGSGTSLFVDLIENRNPGSTTDDAERWTYGLTDDFVGWQLITIPFTDLTRKDIGNGAPNDGLTLTEVHGWALGSLNTGGNLETRYVDQVAIYGNLGGGDGALLVTFGASTFEAVEGSSATITVTLSQSTTEPVTVSYATVESTATPDRDFVPVSGDVVFAPGETAQTFAVQLLADDKAESNEGVMLNLTGVISAELGFQRRAALFIVDDDAADPNLVGDFEGYHPFAFQSGDVQLSLTELAAGNPMALPGQGDYETVATATYDVGGGFTQLFAEPVDWSALGGLTFWYYGAGNGDTVTFELLDNQTMLTGEADPADWELVWSDEFNDPAGTPPNPNVWAYAVGDGTLDGIPGWGNSELQFYSDSTDNVAMDGTGNLVITAREVNTETSTLLCWYGPCEYTSGRLLTKERLDFEHGRIEARIKVPSGGDGIPDGGGVDVGDGLWPAFWMLGDDIDEVGWPQTGEIDIMEVVTREPYEVFGTIHGPGYSGGNSFGDFYTFANPVSDEFHTFAVEWESGEIRWYVDDILYHTAIPSDVAPNEWVFEHPFYILLNLAVGGNFGGAVGENTGFPQEMLVDYVRVYQLPNASERFTGSFVDGVAGWRQVNIAFSALERGESQPAGAPDDGLTLSEVWGYGFHLDTDATRAPDEATVHLDQVLLTPGAPTSVGLSDLGQGSSQATVLVLLGLVALLGGLGLRRRRLTN